MTDGLNPTSLNQTVLSKVSMDWQKMSLKGATVKSKTVNRAKIRYGEKIIELEMKPGETILLDATLNRIK